MLTRKNQSGFAALLVVLVAVVVGAIGLAVWGVIDTNTSKTANRQAGTAETTQLSLLDTATLAQAKELKKVDFDLDGTVNSIDNDDDNDGQNDDVDTDDDNDGVLDDEDNDQDNDGVENDKDNEATQEAELQEAD